MPAEHTPKYQRLRLHLRDRIESGDLRPGDPFPSESALIDEHRLTTMMITHNMNHAIAYGSRLLMMDAGEIIIDVSGREKAALTVPKLLEMFSRIRSREFENDEVLLSVGADGK